MSSRRAVLEAPALPAALAVAAPPAPASAWTAALAPAMGEVVPAPSPPQHTHNAIPNRAPQALRTRFMSAMRCSRRTIREPDLPKTGFARHIAPVQIERQLTCCLLLVIFQHASIGARPGTHETSLAASRRARRSRRAPG